MKYLSRVLMLCTLVLTLSAFTTKNEASVEGNWIGEFTSINHSVSFKVHFWQRDGELNGTIDLGNKGSKELPLSWVMADSSRIHFELVQSSGTLVFDGVLQNGMIKGDLIYANLRGSFQLTPDSMASL